MIQWIKDVLWGLTKNQLRERLKSEGVKLYLVNGINKNVNLPNLTEKEEHEMFSQVVDSIANFLE